MTTRTLILTALTIVGVTAASSAIAGMESNMPLNVSGSMGYGAVKTAINGTGSEFIGCSIYGYAVSGTTVFCATRSASGTMLTCSSTDPDILAAAATITDYSAYSFQVDSAGRCSSLVVYNGSHYMPH